MNITPSVKTRLAMVVMIGPRLIDPRAKVDYFLELFRFSEEKEKVQEVLKARTQFISANAYRQSPKSLTIHGGGENSNSEHTAPSNPFLGIKGLARARDRVQTKTLPKLRQSDPAFTPVTSETLTSGKSNDVQQNGKVSRTLSEPTLQGQQATPSISVKSACDALNQSGGADVHQTNLRKNSKLFLIPLLSAPSQVNPPTNPVVTAKVFTSFSSRNADPPTSPPVTSVSPMNTEFCSVGKVQRLIKLISSNFVPLQDSEGLLGAESTYRDENGNSSPSSKCRMKNEFITPTKGRRNVSDSSQESPSPRAKRISRNLSDVYLIDEDERGSSECTSVESSDAHDSDSTNTWRKIKIKKGVKSLAGDINRLSFERRKGLFEYQSQELNYNSANDSAATEKEYDGEARHQRRGTWSAKRRSGSVPSEEYIKRVHNRNSATFQSIVDQFKVAVNSNNKGTGVLTSMSKDFILYQNMPVEGPCGRAQDGTPLFRYYELVRMNFVKQYDGIKQSELIFAMIDSDFLEHIGVSKVRKRENNFFLLSFYLVLVDSQYDFIIVIMTIIMTVMILCRHLSDSHYYHCYYYHCYYNYYY